MYKKISKPIVLASIWLVFIAGAPAVHADNGVKSIAGTWEINGNPEPTCGVGPFVNLVSISRAGTVINVDPDVGTGVGEVHRTGGKQFGVGFFGFIRTETALLRYEVRGEMTIVNAALLNGTFTATILDPSGNPICAYDGTLVANRLVPDLS